MSLERYFAGLELRAEGRRLVGPAIRYGDVSESHRERFEAGAFNLSDGKTRYLDLGHDPEKVLAFTGGGGLSLRDTSEALQVSATLPRIPAADRALQEVREGKLKGFSIEFHAKAERREGGIRVVSRADLAGVGLVAHPSYEGSQAEVRARGARGSIPFGRNLSCECHDGSCDVVNIQDIELPADRDVLAVAGNYARAIGSAKRGTLKLEKAKDGLRVELTAEALATPAGRELVDMADAVPLYARPIYRQEASEFTEAGDVARYDRMALKAILIGPTDNAAGWPELEVGQARREAIRQPLPKPQKARARRWW